MRTQLRLDFRVFSYIVSSTHGAIGSVNAEIEHLLYENNIRNPGYFVFANTSMLLFWKYYKIMGRSCLRKRNNLDFLCYFHSIDAQFLHYLPLYISQLSKRYRRKLKFLISTFDRILWCVTRSFIDLYVNNTTCFSAVIIVKFENTREQKEFSLKYKPEWS